MKNLKLRSSVLTFAISLILLGSCSSSNSNDDTSDDVTDDTTDDEVIVPPEEAFFYYGADLSYLNEMEDCGAVYKNGNAVEEDPYKIFADAGTNLVRVRLWHNPTWTGYSNLEDVKETIQKSKSRGMKTLLDFHLSDTWADPSKQLIPAAWAEEINNTTNLEDLLYNYIFNTLTELASINLTPDIVQIGNEINPMILQEEELVWPINWTRNALLINKGIRAVRDFSSDVEVMLHIAQPENGLWWFEQATNAGVTDYDWIGLSYYPIWSDYTLNNVSTPLKTLIDTYNKRLMVVETAYPFTLENADSGNNILGEDALIPGYPATQQGQLNYLNALKDKIEEAGGEGLIYWEPAWVSTDCSTLYGQGSHWDNATLFDNNNQATLGLSFYNASRN